MVCACYDGCMTSDTELAAKVAALEERMETRHAQVETAIERATNKIILAVAGMLAIAVAILNFFD